MVSCKNTEEKICLDAELVLEVAENLVSNALRYARTEVAVDIRMAGKELELTVMDDGSGFTVSTQQAMKAYFHSNPQDDLEHSGLGTVSYTHLDVYKRQKLLRPVISVGT